MANFAIALASTETWEGGYVNNPSDSGGETYTGISRRNWPNWPGWPIIDNSKSQVDFPKGLKMNVGLQALVSQFYQQHFWRFETLDDQQVANKLFDFAVNVGMFHCAKIAQQICQVTCDGRIGPKTIAAINSQDAQQFISAFRAQAEKYHEEIVVSHPEDAQFLKGWLRRDAS